MAIRPIKAADLGRSVLSDEELVHKELDLERQIIQIRFQSQLEANENSHSVSTLRRNIARVRTEQRNRELFDEEGNRRNPPLAKDSLRNTFRKTFKYEAAVAEENEGSILDIIE
jgi:ribosomal protein L29